MSTSERVARADASVAGSGSSDEALGKLMRHYEASDEKSLAIALARKLHPEYWPKPSPGRHRKWGDLQRMVLVGDVALVMSERGCSKRDACRILADRDYWAEFLASGNQLLKKRGREKKADPSQVLWEQLKAKNTRNEILDNVLIHWGEMLDHAPCFEWELIARSALSPSMENNSD